MFILSSTVCDMSKAELLVARSVQLGYIHCLSPVIISSIVEHEENSSDMLVLKNIIIIFFFMTSC